MSNTWGKNLTLNIFGESHGPVIGIIIDGLPAGLEVELESIRFEMVRRAPGNEFSSGRNECDDIEIISGVYNNKTTGAPVCAIIENTDQRPQDYAAVSQIARPSHADFTAYMKYAGCSDPRGGGHFSGRLTAMLVFAGYLCKQVLADRGVRVLATLKSVGGHKEPIAKLKKRIVMVKAENDSLGGVVECIADGVPVGWGDPFFDSIESMIASLLFAIPGVKGVHFGAGFQIASMRGSEANDQFLNGGFTATNNSGGINGGISNGMPIIVRAAFRPTPSIGQPQNGLDLETGLQKEMKTEGRHDPCIALRAVPVVEAAVAIALADRALEGDHARPE